MSDMGFSALIRIVDKIINDFKSRNIKSFYASSIIDCLELNRENKSQIERGVIGALNLYVTGGDLNKKFIIFNPENFREKKIYDTEESIPINDNIDFDFDRVYVDSLNDPIIETFFTFNSSQDTHHDKKFYPDPPKLKAPLIKSGRSSGAFKSTTPPEASPKSIDQAGVQARIINITNNYYNGDKVMNKETNIKQDFNNNHINQAAAQIDNKDSNVSFNQNQSDLELVSLINKIPDTENGVINEKIAELKKETKSEHFNKEKVKGAVSTITDMAKAASVTIPVIEKIAGILF